MCARRVHWEQPVPRVRAPGGAEAGSELRRLTMKSLADPTGTCCGAEKSPVKRPGLCLRSHVIRNGLVSTGDMTLEAAGAPGRPR